MHTHTGHEHVGALGGSLASIATAKAGILKPGRPAVLARQQYEEARRVVANVAEGIGCQLVHADEQVCVCVGEGRGCREWVGWGKGVSEHCLVTLWPL